MANNIEIEAKCLITKEEYNQVIDFYKADKIKKIKQTNYYIDTEDLKLKQFGMALRIREKENDFELTLKAPLAEGLLEKNEIISWKQYETYKEDNVFPDCPLVDFIKMLNIKVEDLKILTQLTTDRIEIKDIDESGVLSIDKNSYNNVIDYELEFEGPSIEKASAVLEKICLDAKINYIANTKSKQSRAMETIIKK